MKQSALSIVLVGCGKMGGAMLRGWLASGIAKRIDVVEPLGLPDEFKTTKNIRWFADPGDAEPADIYVMAVKPQVMDDVCASLARKTPHGALILSIAAGRTIASFERLFDPNQPVIRAMPNLPAAIGKGMIVAVANRHVSPAHRRMAEQIMQTSGMLVWAEDESVLNAVTAVSGSGPAYVFLLIEALAKAGEKAGLDSTFAMTLARQTVIGSAALVEQDNAIDAATLRKNVTSPGGTTEAALKILMSGEWQALVDEAIKAATQRSNELSQ